MNVTVPKESDPLEKRVAIAPDNVAAFAKLGYDVRVEAGAGESANFPDSTYESAGATIVSDRSEAWSQADLLLKLDPPTMEEASMIREGASLIGFAYPARN